MALYNIIKLADDDPLNLTQSIWLKYQRSKYTYYIGAHVAFSHKEPKKTGRILKEIGAKAGAVFLSSPQSSKPANITDEIAAEFKAGLIEADIDPSRVLAHSGYTYNLASPRFKFYTQRLIADLLAATKLKLPLVVHPGSEPSGNVNIGIDRVIQCIKKAQEICPEGVILIEFMGDAPIANNGSAAIGVNLDQLAEIINAIKKNIGVCLDTCHMFIGGIDISKPEIFDKFLRDFESKIGLSYLQACHINDAVYELNSHKDHHAPIGRGKIGLDAFKWLLNDPRFSDIPLVTETHLSSQEEIKTELLLLKQMIKVTKLPSKYDRVYQVA